MKSLNDQNISSLLSLKRRRGLTPMGGSDSLKSRLLPTLLIENDRRSNCWSNLQAGYDWVCRVMMELASTPLTELSDTESTHPAKQE